MTIKEICPSFRGFPDLSLETLDLGQFSLTVLELQRASAVRYASSMDTYDGIMMAFTRQSVTILRVYLVL